MRNLLSWKIDRATIVSKASRYLNAKFGTTTSDSSSLTAFVALVFGLVSYGTRAGMVPWWYGTDGNIDQRRWASKKKLGAAPVRFERTGA